VHAALRAIDDAPGTAALTFSRVRGRTVLTRAFSTSPLKLLNPINREAAWVYLANYGGGLVDGDRLQIDIDVQRGATAVIATQGSTKIYRGGRGTSQLLRAEIAADALLVLAPDPIVCFAQSRYAQKLEIHCAPGGSLVLVDWLMGGRIARGERWQLDRFESSLRVYLGDRVALHDALRLTPDDGVLAQRFGRFNHLVSVVIAGRPEALRIHEEIAAMPLDRRADVLISANLVNESLLLRIASITTERAAQTLRSLLAFLPMELGADPWSRTW